MPFRARRHSVVGVNSTSSEVNHAPLAGWRGVEIRRRVGYVAEDPVLFGWMRVRQLISFMQPFYPTWDIKWAKELAERFELPMETRFKHLSKGQGVRVATKIIPPKAAPAIVRHSRAL